MLDYLANNSDLSDALIFCFIGIIVFLTALFFLVDSIDSLRWPATHGIIVSSKVEITTDSDSTLNRPIIYYTYSVNGDKFTSKRISAFPFIASGFIKPSLRLVKKYPKDTNVTVYYDPENPKNSVLERGIRFELLVFLIVGIVIISVSMIYAFKHEFLELIKLI